MTITWGTPATAPFAEGWQIAFDPVAGWLWVRDADYDVATSPDGDTWTAQDIGFNGTWSEVARGAGLWLIATDGGTGYYAISATGLAGDWVEGSFPTAGNYHVCWSERLGLFIAVKYGTAIAYTSPTGLEGSWTARTLPASDNWVSVVDNGTKIVAIAYNSTATATSVDGATWAAGGAMPVSSLWKFAAANPNNGRVVAVSQSANVSAYTDDDGANWLSVALPAGLAASLVFWDSQQFVFFSDYEVSPNENIVLTGNGTAWAVDTSFPSVATDGAYGAAVDPATGKVRVTSYGSTDIEGYTLPGMGDVDHLTVTESVAFALSVTDLPRVVIRSALALAESVALSTEAHVTLSDELALADGYSLIVHDLIADSVAFGITPLTSYTAIARMVDRLLLAQTVSTVAEAHALIADALAFATLTEAWPHNALVDAVEFSAALEAAAIAAASLVDHLALADSLGGAVTATVLLEDSVAFADEYGLTTEATALLRDSLAFTLHLALDDTQYVAWTMNTANKAASRYTNWPFNSSFKVGRTQFAVSDVGLYRIGGPDDDGAAINAKLRLGLSALGSRVLKRIPACYFAFAGGDFFLKVVTAATEDGAREAHVYRVYAQGATTVRELRRKIGRGLKAVYFDQVLENVDGAAFDLEAMDFAPLYLERRIRGNAGGKP